MNVNQQRMYRGLYELTAKRLGNWHGARGKAPVIFRTVRCALCDWSHEWRAGPTGTNNALAVTARLRGYVQAHIREEHPEALAR